MIQCLFCKGKNITKKGKRKTKYEQKQIYYCKTCKKHFIRKKLKNKTYNPTVIINAINYYNLGYTLDESTKLVNQRFKVKITKSSLHNWLTEFSDICSFRKIRKQIFTEFKKEDLIFTNIFTHQGLKYIFRYRDLLRPLK